MEGIKLTSEQRELVTLPAGISIFLEGPAGSGKTTSAIARLEWLLEKFQGNQILILVPQRSLGLPYQRYLDSNKTILGGLPSILTFGGLARRLVTQLWPLIAEEAGFNKPIGQPQFLSTETAQYCMERVISPFMEKGFFRSVTIERNRLYSQILDDLNKSALVPFPLSELANRLKNTSQLEPGLSSAFDQVQTCALEFRSYCLQNNLLDYSLLIETFRTYIWARQDCRDYFYKNARVLIADNVEEDIPVTHDLIKEWLPNLDASLVIIDQNGGYRQFLGADPASAYSLSLVCDENRSLDIPIKRSEKLQHFGMVLKDCILREKTILNVPSFKNELEFQDYHFYPEMIQGVCSGINALINDERISPDDIVVLSPYLSDALNFSLATNFAKIGIPVRSSHPSRKYLSDPVIKALITFAKLAHPLWEVPVTHYQLRDALMVVLPEIDIVRADLIIQTLFSEKRAYEGLRSFDSLAIRKMQERITFRYGEYLEEIRSWLIDYQSREAQPLDVFISRLFGELLSQKEYKLSNDFQSAETISKVIQSIRNFRQFALAYLGFDEVSSGLEYLSAVESGLLPSAIYTLPEENASAIRISPAHTFLMENRQVQYQFWLDIGSMGWWERLNQPLTNPYLLNRNIDPFQKWTEAHEYNANQASMLRVVEGLINRCTKKIIVSTVRINEYGSETRGPLQQAFQALQKRIYHSSVVQDV